MTHAEAEEQFYAIWANQTTAFKNLNAMQLSLNKQSSEISLNSARMLFNKTTSNSLVHKAQHLLGGSARLWIGAVTNLSVKVELMAQFGLTETQVDMIADWLQREDFRS